MTVVKRGSPPENSTVSSPPPSPSTAQTSQDSDPAGITIAIEAGRDGVVKNVTTNDSITEMDENVLDAINISAPPVSPSQSPSLSIHDDTNGNGDVIHDEGSDAESETPVFSLDALQRLDDQLSKQRWVVPVLPNQELHILIESAIKLCKKHLDVNNEACQRFIKESLLLSFTRVMTDEAVKEWKIEILRHIYKLSERCLELCVLKLGEDSGALLEILAMIFNPKNKFHGISQQRDADSTELPGRNIYSKSPNSGPPRGWLVDLLNKFGQLGGFQKISNRFSSGVDLNCSTISAHIKPFGQCYEFLTNITVQTYFQEPIMIANRYMQSITDDELKRETKGDSRENSPMELVRYIRNLSTRLIGQENVVRELELLRLKIILRILQSASFSGKMNALNEISKILHSVSSSSSSSTYGGTSEEYLNVQQVVSWIRDNELLSVAIKENLHIIQYVEKLEKILRFMIKEKALTLNDLDQLWAAQVGKHDAIVKNVHDLLAKVAWDFTAEQLDHLFGCFQRSWNDAPKKQREKLLELIRRLAEDDRDGRCADKVLSLLWNFARNSDVPTDIMDQALQCHAKILDYSCAIQKEQQKIAWLERCIEEIQHGVWVLPAMKHFRDICIQFPEGQSTNNVNWSNSSIMYRARVLSNLQSSRSLVALTSHSLVRYMDQVTLFVNEYKETKDEPSRIRLDGHYDHETQIHERLSFLKFILRDGNLWLCDVQAKEIWDTLIANPIFPLDRETGFKWFVKMMGDMADLDPDIQRTFFEERVLQLDPSCLTESGMKCFDQFFKHVNLLDSRLVSNDRRRVHINNFDLTGQEYMWRVISSCNEDIANRAIELIREVYSHPSPEMIESAKLNQLHTDFVQSCIDRLKAAYDTLSVLCSESDSWNLVQQETVRMTRVLRVLYGYIVSYDDQCNEDRLNVPLRRASLGRSIEMVVHFPQTQGKHNAPAAGMMPVDILTHTNQTLGGLKRQILHQVRMPAASNANEAGANAASVLTSRYRVELLINGEVLDAFDNRRLLDEWNFYGRVELQAKLHQIGRGSGAAGNGSSPGSSSGDSSPGVSPSLDKMDGGDCENLLPSTWLCQKHEQLEFLLRIADLGAKLDCAHLLSWARYVLRAIPGDVAISTKIYDLAEQAVPVAGTQPSVSRETTTSASAHGANSLQSIFFASSPSEVLYYLELIYSMLAPAQDSNPERTLAFQVNFVKAGGLQICLSTLLQNNFMSQTDATTKAMAFLHVLRLLRVLLSVAVHVRCATYASALRNGQTFGDYDLPTIKLFCEYMTNFYSAMPSHLDHLFNLLCVHWSTKLGAQSWLTKVEIANAIFDRHPEFEHARMVIKLAWAAASGNPTLYSTANLEDIHANFAKKLEPNREMQNICNEALEVLLLSVVLNPPVVELLTKERFFQTCVIDMLFGKNEYIRVTVGEYLYILATKTYMVQPRILHFFLTLLFTVLHTTAKEHSRSCRDYFNLLRSLLMFAQNVNYPLQQAEAFFEKEVQWLKEARDYAITNMESYAEDFLLEGHLMISRALLGFLSPQSKYTIGSAPDGPGLVKQLLEDFLLPSSRMFVEQKTQTIQRSVTIMDRMSDSRAVRDTNGAVMPRSATTIYSPTRCVPVCASVQTVTAAYELIVAFCTNCVENMRTIVRLLNEMYFEDSQFALTEWEYAPPVNLRNASLFVGLKNGGATCYMNSVFQQLFMIEPLRNSILNASSRNYCLDDSDTEETVIPGPVVQQSPPPATSAPSESSGSAVSAEKTPAEARTEYNTGILQCCQLIFANLLGSQLQFYVPRRFWKHFRFGNDLINIREQHDALEFFNSLVDSIDEALKAIGEAQICDKIFGGMFADQKICKGCPHRYTREEPFTTLSLDVRNHHNLIESLQEYVKGDLLESENAYLCEKCNRKVDAVKRLCIKKLPPILAIQLKRFDFDWEREQPVKFNDYFEFPREVDMEPYTVDGLAKLDDSEILSDADNNNEKTNQATPGEKTSTHYKLRGIIVHSGQASGGHYYSFILQRLPNGQRKWFKFDDGDVTECRMDDDEEMRNQCFGGEYTTEVYDQYLRRVQQRRHKRWWNAYILFYERSDVHEVALCASFESMTLSGRFRQMPVVLEDIVNRKNMKSCHRRNQFTAEFFQFVRQLCMVHLNLPRSNQIPVEDANLQTLLLLCTQLVSKFLFTTGLRAKRNLRGVPQDWTDIMTWLFRLCPTGRAWFASEILFKNPHRFAEYLLESPSADVRMIFGRILVFLAHYGNKDPAACVQTASERSYRPCETVADLVIRSVLNLLEKEVSDHGRHLKEYFGSFHAYANLGIEEKRHLLALNVPSLFIRVLFDEGPGPPIKSMTAELQKLYATISVLIRSCDVTALCKSLDDAPLLPNPSQDATIGLPLMTLPSDVVERIYEQPPRFLKKLVDDAVSHEDTVKLLKFLCWENFELTKVVLACLLQQIRYSLADLRPLIECWLHLLLLDDSWVEKRVTLSLLGADEHEGLFQFIQVQFSHHQRRCYLLIKMLTNLLETSPAARRILHNHGEMKRRWIEITQWLHGEVSGRGHYGSGYNYTGWTPPSQSNETSTGMYLERTKSARITLAKVLEITRELIKDEEEQQSQQRENEDKSVDAEENVDILGSTKPDLPSHPPPPYSPKKFPPPIPPPPPPPPTICNATELPKTGEKAAGSPTQQPRGCAD